MFSVLLQYTGIEMNQRNVQSRGILKFVLFTLLTNQITLEVILKAQAWLNPSMVIMLLIIQ